MLPADGWWEKFCLNGAWMARFRRLARDHERLATILGPFYFLAFACLIILSHPVCQIESGLILRSAELEHTKLIVTGIKELPKKSSCFG